MRPILFRGGRIIDPSQDMDMKGDILVKDGIISEVSRHIEPREVFEVVDLSGRWVTPGLIDMHVHLREPGEEYKETIASGAAAAVAGGFTSVACMPNTRPVNDSSSITRFILDQARKAAAARIYPVASITKGQQGAELTEFGDLIGAGAAAFSDDGFPVGDAGVMRLALEYAKTFDALIISHSEEAALSDEGAMNEGRISTMLGLKGIPAAAEKIAIFRDVALAELTGSRIHVAHVSTGGSVEVIRQAKARGVRVTAETAPHYFSLTEEAVLGYDTNAKMNPPLRTEEDRLAVIEGLRDGTIDAVATDHAPHSTLEKDVEFQLASNGIIGLETAVPLALELVRKRLMTPSRMIASMSLNPANILGISGGSLAQGSPADLTVIDPDVEFDIIPENLLSKSHNTPFFGQTLKGRAILTLVGGKVAHDCFGII